MRLPIYPSDETIFPGQLVPLSPKTTDMERVLCDCREQRQPLGVVLATGAHGHSLAGVGTLVYVMDFAVTSGQGVPDVLIVGQYRFRVLQIHQDQSYLEATVRLWPWIEEPRPEWGMVQQMGMYLRRYVEALSGVLPPLLLPEILQPTASTLGVLGAGLLQLPVREKQRILELPTAHALLSIVLTYMRIYVPIAERLAEIPLEIPVTNEYVSLN